MLFALNATVMSFLAVITLCVVVNAQNRYEVVVHITARCVEKQYIVIDVCIYSILQDNLSRFKKKPLLGGNILL